MKLPSSIITRAIPLLGPILLLILGRCLVDTQWNMPRIGFSLLLFYFFAAFLQRWAAVGASLALEGLLLNISYAKERATGEPLLGVDLFEIGQGMALTGYIDQYIVGYTLITFVSIALGLWYFPGFSKTRSVLALMLCGILAMQLDHTGRYSAYAQPLMSQYLGSNYVSYNFRENAKQNGMLGHLILSAETLHKPSAGQHNFYDVRLPAANNARDPDVFIVMCESCYTSQDGRFSTRMDALSEKGFSSARVISPVYGGGTAEAEFEALTGLSAFTIPGVDFQNFATQFSDRIDALPSHYARAGYTTLGMHNYFGSFWKRNLIYPKLGFQKMAFVENMKWKRDGWPKDEMLYNHALTQYELAPKGKKQFMFLVTVMTHGPFIKQNDNGLKQYQDRMNTAIESFEQFADRLEASAKARGREVVVVIFGDHKPGLNQDFRDAGILDQSFFSEKDPRNLQFKTILNSEQTKIRGEVPLYIRDSRHPQEAAAIAERLQDRPIFCLSAEMARLTTRSEPFFDAVAERCEKNVGFYDKELWWRNIFPEAVYAERLFAK